MIAAASRFQFMSPAINIIPYSTKYSRDKTFVDGSPIEY